MLDQISTKVRPNRRHKTDRPHLDGAGVDIHAAIGKLPKPKRGWTLPGHNYTGPYNPLEQQVEYDPETGQILQIYQHPTRQITSITKQILQITSKQQKTKKKKRRLRVIKSKARRTICLMQAVKEAKVQDFAILFLVLSWLHQGNHPCLLIFQRAH